MIPRPRGRGSPCSWAKSSAAFIFLNRVVLLKDVPGATLGAGRAAAGEAESVSAGINIFCLATGSGVWAPHQAPYGLVVIVWQLGGSWKHSTSLSLLDDWNRASDILSLQSYVCWVIAQGLTPIPTHTWKKTKHKRLSHYHSCLTKVYNN